MVRSINGDSRSEMGEPEVESSTSSDWGGRGVKPLIHNSSRQDRAMDFISRHRILLIAMAALMILMTLFSITALALYGPKLQSILFHAKHVRLDTLFAGALVGSYFVTLVAGSCFGALGVGGFLARCSDYKRG